MTLDQTPFGDTGNKPIISRIVHLNQNIFDRKKNGQKSKAIVANSASLFNECFTGLSPTKSFDALLSFLVQSVRFLC